MLIQQAEIHTAGPLLDADGHLCQVGWSRQPLLDCNLENVRIYRLRALQRFRLKRWDYYALFTPFRFFSATLADLGYAGQVFAYTVDLVSGDYHEETLTVPLARNLRLPRNSTEGVSAFDNGKVRLTFDAKAEERSWTMAWPSFQRGQGFSAEVTFRLPPHHESLTIVIPIGQQRFYYNRKVNCMPAQGWVEYAGQRYQIRPEESLGSLDWGRGVWEYRSFWVWASASGFLPDRRTVGLNLGGGFGDTSAATENALILDGRIHKLAAVAIHYDASDFMRPWHMLSPDGRLDLEFVPFKERLARANLGVIASEVHQMFGRYHGTALTDAGERIRIDGLVGFAEEHRARW